MAERAAHLVDGVLGGLPIRQWVLTLPYRLRYALAWDHRLCRAVLAVFVRAVLGCERRRAARRGARGGTGGAVTAIQRFGSALNTNVHFHTLVAQGVFVEQADGTRRFFPLPGPTDREVARLLAAVRRRIVRLVHRHGIDLEHPSHEGDADQLRLDCPTLAEIQGAAVVGRVVTGARSGAAVQRLGRAIRTRRRSPQAVRCTRVSRASISMPPSPHRPATVPGWITSAAYAELRISGSMRSGELCGPRVCPVGEER